MARTVVSITPPFGKIKPITDLTIFSDVKNYVPKWDTADYLNACRKYAIENKVYLIPSRFVVDNILYMCMFSPEGDILGIQGATHLNLYNQEGFDHYNKIEVLDTPIGAIFLSVDVDIYHPEVIRLARMKGAQIVVASQFIDSYQLSRHMVTTGIWNAAQTNGIYVVGCCNCFSTICAPCPITAQKDGFIVQPAHSHNLFCKLFLNKLERTEFGGYFNDKLDLHIYSGDGAII